MKVKKVFDKEGGMSIRFNADATEQIKDWLALSGTSLKKAMPYSTLIDDCPVFGKAIEFPCVASYD